ncbi:MAG: acetylxylan esterase [Clostridia bacterium]|nr:acetylxylan esterase [Clostridia bacterium]
MCIAFDKLIEERKLPPLLQFASGAAVTREGFEQRRTEMLQLLQNHVYGTAPAAPSEVRVAEKSSKAKEFAGKATVRELMLSFDADKGEFSFPVTEVRPNGVPHKCPMFVLLNFRPDIPDKYLPIEEILDAGYGVLRIYYNDVAKDCDDGFSGGIAAMYDRSKYTWGKLQMWAFAASRALDYLLTTDYVDKGRIAVAGHSRLGKTALLAAALDTRFALACVNDSGCSGAALTRGKTGERISDITTRFPYWFCENYKKYAGNEESLPFDQHFLIACVAPRRVAIGAAVEDLWADTDAQYLAACAASPAWELLGKRGFVHPDRLPEVGDFFSAGSVTFHLREGTHFFSRADWHCYLSLL